MFFSFSFIFHINRCVTLPPRGQDVVNGGKTYKCGTQINFTGENSSPRKEKPVAESDPAKFSSHA
jgi:hypothetical protein